MQQSQPFLFQRLQTLPQPHSVIMEAIKDTFARCKKEQRSALVTYVTAGYPTPEDTVDVMLGMEAGGAGMIQSSSCAVAVGSTVMQISLNLAFPSRIRLQMVQRSRKQTRKH